MSNKTKPHNRYSDALWGQVQVAYAAGVKIRDLADTFGIPYNTVANRVSKFKWRAQRASFQQQGKPTTLQGRQEQMGILDKPSSLTEVVLEDWKKKGDEHRVRIHELSQKLLSQAEAVMPTVETVKDLDILDQMARRALGLDASEKQTAPTCIINLALLQQSI